MKFNRRGNSNKISHCERENRMKQEVRFTSRKRYNKNPEQGLLRRQDQKSTVFDLVYKYLKRVAYMDSVRKQRNNACGKFRSRNARRRIIHPTRRHLIAGDHGIRSYISKALSFAVHSGYLIPTDCTGRFLQLSSSIKLPNFFM